MEACALGYIPIRLHTNDRQPIETFAVGEFMYRRCKPEEVENPFLTISLTELSHNRSGYGDNVLSNPDDVLFNIGTKEEKERYNLVICELEILDLNNENKYSKEFSEEKNGQTYVARMEIIHEPDSCMYPHCVFRIWVNEQKVTFDNYKDTLKKLNVIRSKIKEELASMIIREKISQRDGPTN